MNNKYQEALEKLINYLPKEEFMSWGRDCEMLLQELVGKEIPMKVLTNTRFDEESKVYLSFQYCKRCNNIVRRFQPRCEEWGQDY